MGLKDYLGFGKTDLDPDYFTVPKGTSPIVGREVGPDGTMVLCVLWDEGEMGRFGKFVPKKKIVEKTFDEDQTQIIITYAGYDGKWKKGEGIIKGKKRATETFRIRKDENMRSTINLFQECKFKLQFSDNLYF